MIQNAELRRSNQILQQGIVESMKGNKARFVGNQTSGARRESKEDNKLKLPNLQDIEDLKKIIERKREQV